MCSSAKHTKGTLIGKEDLANVKSPVSLVCIENDQLFPDEIREEGRKIFATKQIEHEIQVYPGVPHGEFSHSSINITLLSCNIQVLLSMVSTKMSRFKRRRRKPSTRCLHG